MHTWRVVTKDQSETETLAERIGKRVKGGETIELISDLGGGKTAFVRGLARGMGSRDQVASPTFTISREYRADRLTLYHFDFYRLQDPGLMTDELAEVIGDDRAVVAVEWSDIVRHILPDDRLSIYLKLKGEDERELSFSCPPSLKYLMPEGS